MKAILFALSLCFAGVACGPPPPPAPVAADNGQPRMQAARNALLQAQSETQAAEPNKGGHREKALELINQAIAAVDQGMQYAAAHPHEIGPDEGPAEPEPVDEDVAGANGQPHMHNAVVALREARKQLKEASRDKGGFRKQAIHATNEAINQLREGIRFADHH